MLKRMSLRSSKVDFLKYGLTSLNSGTVHSYCTKPRTVDDQTIIFVNPGDSQRRSNELLGNNPKYPFPGGVGLASSTYKSFANLKKKPEPKPQPQKVSDDGRQKYKLTEIPIILQAQMRVQPSPDYKPEAPIKIDVLKAERDLELKAIQCPKSLKKDLKDLFLDVDMHKDKNITVLNLTQKSKTDMSAWSPEMEEERDKLTKDFINVATSIVADLNKLSGGKYWADFIEPASGRPYFARYTNAALFETDDRYRELGFLIEDLGCCKVIKHLKWAANAFVGTIFTDAPLDSPEVQAILDKSAAKQYFDKPSEE